MRQRDLKNLRKDLASQLYVVGVSRIQHSRLGWVFIVAFKRSRTPKKLGVSMPVPTV